VEFQKLSILTISLNALRLIM